MTVFFSAFIGMLTAFIVTIIVSFFIGKFVNKNQKVKFIRYISDRGDGWLDPNIVPIPECDSKIGLQKILIWDGEEVDDLCMWYKMTYNKEGKRTHSTSGNVILAWQPWPLPPQEKRKS